MLSTINQAMEHSQQPRFLARRHNSLANAGGNRNGSAYVDTLIRSRVKDFNHKKGGAHEQRECAPKIFSSLYSSRV